MTRQLKHLKTSPKTSAKRTAAFATSAALAAALFAAPASAQSSTASGELNPLGSSALFHGMESAMKGGISLGSSDAMADLIASDNADPTGFYSSLPESLDAKPGDIIKTESSQYGLGWSVPGWDDSHITRIAYASEDVNGNIIPRDRPCIHFPCRMDRRRLATASRARPWNTRLRRHMCTRTTHLGQRGRDGHLRGHRPQ